MLPLWMTTLDILETEFDCIKESFVSEEFFRLAEVIRISYGLPLPSTLQNTINLFGYSLKFLMNKM